MENKIKFMWEAIRVAKEAINQGELPIASVLVLNNEIIASGFTTEVRDKRFLVHAELHTLLEADRKNLSYKDRKKSQLFTTLEPCMMCLGTCMSFFLGNVYYALESPGDGAVQMAQKWHRKEDDIPGYSLPKIEGGILRNESINLFQEYVDSHSCGAMWEWAKTLASLAKM
ncbi:MAG: nucleoside deaminase [Bacteriovoracaceae bacterium]|nr:nucleoside deaminase [Bacteriovoracaceae bacterium]